MAKAARKQEKQPSGYGLLVGRVQRLINSPPVQRARAVTLRKLDEETREDWERLLDEFSQVLPAHSVDVHGEIFASFIFLINNRHDKPCLP